MISIVIFDWETKVNKVYLKKLKEKRVTNLITKSSGLDHIDLKAASKLSVRVHALTTYHVHSTAEHYFNLLFKLVRPNETRLGRELFNKKILILGSSGRVGAQCSRIAKAFGMHVIPFDLVLGDSKAVLNNLVKEAEVIFLCIPLNKETRNILNPSNFKKMRGKPFIVNGARKGLINLDHIEAALKENLVSGYALDDKTFHSVKKHRNFFSCIRHMGAKTVEAQQKSKEEVNKIIVTIKRNYESKELN